MVMAGPISGALDADDATTTVTGEGIGDYLGSAVGAAGDTNGDGVADLVVVASGAGLANAGRAYVFLGPLGAGDIDAASAEGIIDGAGATDRFGHMSSGGDVDGDGLADLLVGAPDDGEGAAWLFLGPVTGVLDTADARASVRGDADGDRAAAAVASGLDFDGDGFGDLAVGAESRSHAEALDGTAYVVRGPISGDLNLETDSWLALRGAAASTYAGWNLASAGDVNSDGYDDLVVCSPRSGAGGEAWVIMGPTTGGERSLTGADATLAGSTGDGAGWACASGGDMNQDGASDLLVGAPEGALAWFVYGPVTGRIDLLSEGDLRVIGVEDSFLGASLAGLGDVTGNGLDDFAVGAPCDASEAAWGGAAYVVQGLGL